MAQGSAFPVKWQVHSPFVKLSRAGWTPEGPRVCIQLVSSAISATSALWPEHELPSDSGLVTLPHRGESHVPVLICSAHKCLSAPLLRALASTLPGNVGTRHHSSKRQRTADAWKKKKKPMPLRVGHTRSMGQEKTNCWPFGKVTSFFLPPKLPPALNQRPVFCVFPQLCLAAQPGGPQRSFHPASSFLRTKQIQEK